MTKKVSQILILIFILTIFLSGCGSPNFLCLSDFVLPDDIDFLYLTERLNNPKRICQYVADNFEYEYHPYIPLTPYQLYVTKKGDCYDTAIFEQFMANYHNFQTYQIHIFFKRTVKNHALTIYLENGKYTYSSNGNYYPLYASSFSEIVLDYFIYHHEFELKSYKVYDYNMNLIETNYASL